MNQRILGIKILSGAIGCLGLFSAQATELKVLSDRTESHLAPLFAAFTKDTGIEVKASFLDKGLIERLKSRPTEADLVITKDADLLVFAKEAKLLAPFASKLIEAAVPANFRDPHNHFLVDAYRGRVILHSKDRVKSEELSTYATLSEPKWKGRLCIRSGFHDYNLGLFGQFFSAWGNEKAGIAIRGWRDNLARKPTGNDRAQAQAIFENKCDIAIINTYYYPMMMQSAEQKPWAEATNVFFPNQDNEGTLIMRSGAALTTAKRLPQEAIRLLEYLVGQQGQTLTVQTTFQYPVNPAVEIHPVTRTIGQASVKNGVFKIQHISLESIAKFRNEVLKTLTELNFDGNK